MRIAVTGASGFIGNYLVPHLAAEGHDVLALGRDMGTLNTCFENQVEKKETDYSEASLKQQLNNVDIVVHLAAKRMSKDIPALNLSSFLEENVITTENVLKSAHFNSVNRVCNISSISVYSGENRLPFKEEDKALPSCVYGLSKLFTEKYSALFSKRTGLPVINLRLAQVIGVGERSDVMFTKFLNLAKQKKPITIWGNGKNNFDFIYVKDVIEAISKVISLGTFDGSANYNIGSGQALSVLEMAQIINLVFENEGNLKFNYSKKGEILTRYMDCSKAEKELQWKSRWNLDEAVFDIKKMISNNDF